MIDKTTAIEEAVSHISDGDTVMVGGFGVPGTPFALIRELVRQGQRGLTLIKNDANEAGMGVDHLLVNGQVDRLIVSHIGLNPHAMRLMNEGRLQVEFCAQGVLAERIRAAGAGLPGFLTDIAIGTEFAAGKRQIAFNGRDCIIESSLKADIALVHAASADSFGNLVYEGSAQNFNPLMAMAADRVIVETARAVDVGGIAPASVQTPGPFVDHVVLLPELTEEYAVVRRHGKSD